MTEKHASAERHLCFYKPGTIWEEHGRLITKKQPHILPLAGAKVAELCVDMQVELKQHEHQ